jgi:DNA-binding PadR family transcriptional regulator
VLKYLLLALLGSGPRHGYELKALFDDAYGAVWTVNITQIYTALPKLEDEGLVECEVVPQSNLPNRKVYSLTPIGRKELDRWTSGTGPAAIRLRDDLYFKVLAQMELNPDSSLRVISEHRQACLGLLAELTRRQEISVMRPGSGLLLEAAALRIEAELRWLGICEERVKGTW